MRPHDQTSLVGIVGLPIPPTAEFWLPSVRDLPRAECPLEEVAVHPKGLSPQKVFQGQGSCQEEPHTQIPAPAHCQSRQVCCQASDNTVNLKWAFTNQTKPGQAIG